MFYKVFKEILVDEEMGEFETYGIRCGEILEARDVSLNFESINNFVNELNKNEVELACVSDMIEDFICEEDSYN